MTMNMLKLWWEEDRPLFSKLTVRYWTNSGFRLKWVPERIVSSNITPGFGILIVQSLVFLVVFCILFFIHLISSFTNAIKIKSEYIISQNYNFQCKFVSYFCCWSNLSVQIYIYFLNLLVKDKSSHHYKQHDYCSSNTSTYRCPVRRTLSLWFRSNWNKRQILYAQ